MKTATVRQLRTEFPRIEAWLADGESIAITKHNHIVAELVAPRVRKPDFARRFRVRSNRPILAKGAVELLIEERGA